ncbi:endonuclease-reverse transcriptase [Danaus plexippus plexippus]|uniref:Endonuclease-reverse transcriptase n=1 Tax=Danaus plexippus plexippus TaxID=278856 RepID=A0A212FLG2_DANPL|nr:endonuclease-reverse transcriptase [Danaus plexippus plexippus]
MAHTWHMFQKVEVLVQEFIPKHWNIEGQDGATLMDKDAILETELAMMALKLKAFDSDWVTTQIIRNMGTNGNKIMQIICQKFWRTALWPKD